MLIVLFALIATAAAAQIVIASGDDTDLPGPLSPGQMPSSATASGP